MQAWIYLLVAGIFEVGWAVGLKYSLGFSRWVPSVITVICMIISFGFLALALRALPLGTAYAIWTGIGAAGTAVAGLILFGESRDPVRLAFLCLIVIGVVGLKVFSGRATL